MEHPYAQIFLKQVENLSITVWTQATSDHKIKVDMNLLLLHHFHFDWEISVSGLRPFQQPDK